MSDNLKRYFDEPLGGGLSKVHERNLAKKKEGGDEQARNKLIIGNLRLVIDIAKNYNVHGIELLDLIQAGNKGLIKAVDKFDPEKEYRLSTFATWCIRKRIIEKLTDKWTLKVPVGHYENIKKLKESIKDLTEETNKKPSLEEISEEIGFGIEKIISILKTTTPASSLDASVIENEETTRIDLTKRRKKLKEEKEIETQERIEKLKELMDKTLSDREKQIVKLKYGFEDLKPRTLQEVGKIFDLSRERIRQLKERAIEKMQEEVQN